MRSSKQSTTPCDKYELFITGHHWQVLSHELWRKMCMKHNQEPLNMSLAPGEAKDEAGPMRHFLTCGTSLDLPWKHCVTKYTMETTDNRDHGTWSLAHVDHVAPRQSRAETCQNHDLFRCSWPRRQLKAGRRSLAWADWSSTSFVSQVELNGIWWRLMVFVLFLFAGLVLSDQSNVKASKVPFLRSYTACQAPQLTPTHSSALKLSQCQYVRISLRCSET